MRSVSQTNPRSLLHSLGSGRPTEGGIPPDWRCGSVETCRKAPRLCPGASFRLRRQRKYSRSYGTGDPEAHQKGIPQHRRQQEEKEEGRRVRRPQPEGDGRGRAGGQRFQSGHRGPGVHRSGGPLRLRQVHHPAHGGRTGGDQRRRAVHRWPADERRGPQGPGHRHGLPELCPVPPHDRV